MTTLQNVTIEVVEVYVDLHEWVLQVSIQYTSFSWPKLMKRYLHYVQLSSSFIHCHLTVHLVAKF